jgi:hypothetical protein
LSTGFRCPLHHIVDSYIWFWFGNLFILLICLFLISL